MNLKKREGTPKLIFNTSKSSCTNVDDFGCRQVSIKSKFWTRFRVFNSTLPRQCDQCSHSGQTRY